MKRILVLLKKDITLDISNMLIVMLVSIGLPLYTSYAFNQAGLNIGVDFLSLFLNSFYCFFLAFSKLGIIENKYRGMAYLTLTPVTRKDIVLSKYFFSAFVFLISIVGYKIANFIMSSSQSLTYSSIIIVWTVVALVIGIYIPLEFKVGYENVKYYLTAIIVVSPFLIGLLGKYTKFDFFKLFMQAGSGWLPILLVFSGIIHVVSYSISVRIFEKKDL